MKYVYIVMHLDPDSRLTSEVPFLAFDTLKKAKMIALDLYTENNKVAKKTLNVQRVHSERWFIEDPGLLRPRVPFKKIEGTHYVSVVRVQKYRER